MPSPIQLAISTGHAYGKRVPLDPEGSKKERGQTKEPQWNQRANLSVRKHAPALSPLQHDQGARVLVFFDFGGICAAGTTDELQEIISAVFEVRCGESNAVATPPLVVVQGV